MTTQEQVEPGLNSGSKLPLNNQSEHPLFTTGGRLMPDRLYSASEVCCILGVKMSTLRRWRSEGKGPQVTRIVSGGRPMYRGLHVVQALEDAVAD